MDCSLVEMDGNVRLLRLAGELDHSGVLAIEAKVLDHCGGPRPLVLIDLSETRFVSSRGIHLLLQAVRIVAEGGGCLLLLNPSASVGSALEISGLSSQGFRGSESDAVATLRRPRQGDVPS
jgi:anti-anti-sigma factor